MIFYQIKTENTCFKILDSHNFERTIKFGSKYYINKMDKYNINHKDI